MSADEEGPDFEAITIAGLQAAGHLKWTLFGPGRIGAFVAEMDFGTAPAVTTALRAAVDRAAFGYLPRPLEDGLAAACAAWHDEAYGWAVEPADVHLLPDVLRGLEIAINHYSRAGSPVILPVPAYMPFLTVPAMLGRETITVDMVSTGGRYELDLDGLERAYARGGDLLIVCNPHNPLGRVMDREELLAISEIVDRHGGRVFSDEIHGPLVHPGHRHVPYASVSPAAAGHTLTATSASKAWNLAGLACAELILSNDADRARWEEIPTIATHGASILGVVAQTAAFLDGRHWLDRVLAQLDANRRLLVDLLAEHLPAVRYTPPEGTYLAWLDCRELGIAGDLADFFTDQADVVLVDGTRCDPSAQGFVRLNLATSPAILTRMVSQMGAAVARHAGRSGPPS